MRVQFHLVATIAEDDKKAFDKFSAEHKHRIRNEVISKLSLVKPEDLTDTHLHNYNLKIFI